MPADTTSPAQGGLDAAFQALDALVTLLERKHRDLASLRDRAVATDGYDSAEANRLRAKIEGLTLALDDARFDRDQAAQRVTAAIDRDSYADLIKDDTVPLINYSVALDEIWTLRRALAYEATGLAVHLDYKSFPKSRRTVAETQVERMRAAARGHGQHAYGDRPTQVLRSALRDAGAQDTLTRHQFETEKGLKR